MPISRAFVHLMGGEIGAYWGYVTDGVYMSQEEIDNGPVDREGNPTVGDLRFKDINGDGVVDIDDLVLVLARWGDCR